MQIWGSFKVLSRARGNGRWVSKYYIYLTDVPWYFFNSFIKITFSVNIKRIHSLLIDVYFKSRSFFFDTFFMPCKMMSFPLQVVLFLMACQDSKEYLMNICSIRFILQLPLRHTRSGLCKVWALSACDAVLNSSMYLYVACIRIEIVTYQ